MFAFVQTRFGYHYMYNANHDSFLTKYNYFVPLHYFYCFMYGNINHTRKLIMVRFLGQCKAKTLKTHYYIQTYENGTPSDPFWVEDIQKFRTHFYHFDGVVNFLRTTFLYDPHEKELFRLHEIRYFLHLPILKVETPIYVSPTETLEYVPPQEGSHDTALVSIQIRKQIMLQYLQKSLLVLQSISHTQFKEEEQELFKRFIQIYHERFSH